MTTASFFLCMPDSNWLDLVLIRHGIAEPRVQGLDHPERPLTSRGRQRTHAVMEALLGRGLVLDRLISSPYRRALETAQLALQVRMAPQWGSTIGFVPADQRWNWCNGCRAGWPWWAMNRISASSPAS